MTVAGRLGLVLAASVAWSACPDLGSLVRPDAGADASPPAPDAAGPEDSSPGVDASEPAETIVRIHDLSFDPAEVHVRAGTTVRWVMDDPGTFHFVVEGGPRDPEKPEFRSPRLDPSDTWTMRFDTPGEYLYFCANHSTVMRNARVIVE